MFILFINYSNLGSYEYPYDFMAASLGLHGGVSFNYVIIWILNLIIIIRQLHFE